MEIFDFRKPVEQEDPLELERRKSESRLIKEDTQYLQQKSEAFDWANPQMDPIELASLLVREMVDQSGLGLSAIQIGIPLRAFVIRAQPKHIVLFNPMIVSSSDETESQYEGCLSYPNLLVKIKRAFEVRVRFSQPDREVRTEKWGGLTARIVQHEMDHLDGILFFNRASKFHRDQAFRKQKQYQRTLKRAK